jgi:hypothetical protein
VEVRWVFLAEQRPYNPPDDPDDPDDPDRPDRPDRPDNPEEPEEILEIREEIPQAVPEPEQAEIIEAEEEIPLVIPILPRTGALPAGLYYILGSLLFAVGVRMKKKD